MKPNPKYHWMTMIYSRSNFSNDWSDSKITGKRTSCGIVNNDNLLYAGKYEAITCERCRKIMCPTFRIY